MLNIQQNFQQIWRHFIILLILLLLLDAITRLIVSKSIGNIECFEKVTFLERGGGASPTSYEYTYSIGFNNLSK